MLEERILPQFLKITSEGSIAVISWAVLSRQGSTQFGQQGLVCVVLGCRCGWGGCSEGSLSRDGAMWDWLEV